MDHSPLHNLLIEEEDSRTWLVTYADLVTLLLVFFILLYTLAYFEKEKYRSGLRDLETRFSAGESMDPQEHKWKSRPIRLDEFTGIRSRQKELIKSVNRFARTLEMPDSVHTENIGNKIVIRVSGEALFASGSADLNPGVTPSFDYLIRIFNQYPEYQINIKGHTDDRPIATRRFPSNWDLSAIRATTVLKYMVSRGIQPNRLTATGYGDALPRVPNDTDANRAINRRVEFVLEKKEIF